jgi:hypothetical protein
MSSILKVDQLQDSGGNSIITKDGSNLTVEVKANNDASLGVARNKLIFHDTDTAVATGQSAGAIEFKQDGGTLGAGTVGKIECITEGTGGSYAMTFSNGNASGSGSSQFAEHMRVNSSGDLKFNSGYGSVETAYGVRVWLRYDQVNNVVEASGGVSSVTDSSTGSYIINFTNNMPDADYALGGWSGRNANPTVTGASNFHNVGNITINTGDSVNNAWLLADVDDSTVIIVK